MTIEEYIKNYMKAINCKHKYEDIYKLVENEARKVAKNGCAVFTEEDVEKVIDNADKLMKNKSENKVVKMEVKTNSAKTNSPKPTPKKTTYNKPKSSNNNKVTTPKSEFDFEQLGLF